MVVQTAPHEIGTAFEAGPLLFQPQPSLCGLQRLVGGLPEDWGLGRQAVFSRSISD